MPTVGGPTMYRPYRVCMRGRAADNRHAVCWGTSHHVQRLAEAAAMRWHTKWVSLAPEIIYLYDWQVVDTRADLVVWQWKQE